MPTFVIRLTTPRPDFAMTMSDAEREIMGRHAAEDPVVTTGTGAIEVGTMLAGFVRP